MRAAWRAQQGVAALFMAISLVGLLSAMGFALDLGQIYMARAELRKLTETSALSAATTAAGCISPTQDRTEVAGRAIQTVLGERRDVQSSFIFGEELIGPGGRRVLGPLREDAEFANAVSVTLTRPLPNRIMPLLPRPADATMRVTAQAVRSPIVQFTVGSVLASIDPGDSALLGPLLQGLLGATNPIVISAAQLADAVEGQVPLLGLVEEAGVGTLQQLLVQQTTLVGFLDLVAGTLLDVGSATATSAAGVIQTLAANAPATQPVAIGELLGLSANVPNAVVDTSISAYELANTVLLNSLVPDQLLGIPLGVEVAGGAVAIDVFLGVGDNSAATGAGPVLRDADENFLTRAASKELDVQLDLSVSLPGLSNVADLKLIVEAAEVDAELVDLTCPSPFPNNIPTVTLRPSTDVATLSINDGVPQPLLRLSGADVLALLGVNCSGGLLGLGGVLCGALNQDLLEVRLAAGPVPISQDCGPSTLSYRGPFASAEAPDLPPVVQPYPDQSCLVGGISAGLADLFAPGNLDLSVHLLGGQTLALNDLQIVRGTVEGLLRNAVLPLGSEIDAAIIRPLLGLLGTRVAGADIAVNSFRVGQAELFAIDPD